MGDRRCNLPIESARGSSEPTDSQRLPAFRLTIAERLARLLFAAALLIGSFAYGAAVARYEVPFQLMFDNHGGDAEGGPSRLLAVDLATGEERTIFPTREHPARLGEAFSGTAGNVDIAPDGERALVVFSTDGAAYEIRLEDGAILAEYHHVHDVSMVDSLPEEDRMAKAGVFVLYGVNYIGVERNGGGA